METKNCIGCSQSIELKKFYFNKSDGGYSSRCGACYRKQVLRRYHSLPKPKRAHHGKSCNECEYFTGSVCRKTPGLKPWLIKKKADDMKDEQYRSKWKRCFVKMVISQVRSA